MRDNTTSLDTSTWRILIDLPHKHPVLGFDGQARALEKIITNSQPRFAIGIFGAWGSGKTTLMNAIRDRLLAKKVVVAEFCAWRYEREEHILVPLLDTLRQAMEDWTNHYGCSQQSIAKQITSAAKTLGEVTAALIAGTTTKINLGVLELSLNGAAALAKAKELGAESAASKHGPLEATLSSPAGPQSLYHKSFVALKKTFEELLKHAPDLRFVIFVDDLDRCLPKSMVDSLEAIKLFFDLDGFVFVVGVDREVAQDAVEARHDGQRTSAKQTLRGAEYLKKIFQVPFSLPVIRRAHLGQLLRSFEEDAGIPETQSSLLQGAVKIHLGYAMSEFAINPRAVKRYINDFTIQMMVKPDLNPDSVLTLATLETRSDWRQVYQALVAEEVGFHDYLRQLIEDKAAEQDADPEYPIITQELRAYLAGPGRALIAAEDISAYLSSSAVVSDTTILDTQSRELARNVARFRNATRAAADASDESLREKLFDVIAFARALLPLPNLPGSGDLTERIIAFEQRLAGPISTDNDRSTAKQAVALGNQLRQLVQMATRASMQSEA